MGVVVSRGSLGVGASVVSGRCVAVRGGGVVGSAVGRPFRFSVLVGAFAPAWCRPAVALWRASSGCSLPVRAVFGWGCGVGVGLPVSRSSLFVWGVRCGGGVVLFASGGGVSGRGSARLLWRWRLARRRVRRLGRVPRGSALGSLCWLAGRPSVLVVRSVFGRVWCRGFWGSGRRWC